VRFLFGQNRAPSFVPFDVRGKGKSPRGCSKYKDLRIISQIKSTDRSVGRIVNKKPDAFQSVSSQALTT
jgi:hypothetical protein